MAAGDKVIFSQPIYLKCTPNWRDYTYDASGNRSTQTVTSGTIITVTTYTINEQNRLTNTLTVQNSATTQTVAYSYDNNGNQLTVTTVPYVNGVAQTAQVTTCTFDKLNQLATTAMPDGINVTDTYNGEGYRVTKQVNSQITKYVYVGDKVVLELDGSNNQTARNVQGTSLIARTAGGTTLYYMYNGHADVTALIDVSGTIQNTYYYDAFGNILETSENVNNPFTYAGYQYDKETGLYYLNARYYDPIIARFLSEDTFRGIQNDPLSLNLYTYTANNPLKYYDPSGHWYEETDEDGNTYQVVEEGDTLWGLAEQLTGNGSNWTDLGYTEEEAGNLQEEQSVYVSIWSSEGDTSDLGNNVPSPSPIEMKPSNEVDPQGTGKAKIQSFTQGTDVSRLGKYS